MPHTFDVCYEDQQLLVVNKRAVVATMGVAAAKPSLLAAAKQYLAGDRGDADCFAAVSGRLDFPVAGLVVIAKDPVVADHLRRQQEAGSIRKIYHALVAGRVDPPTGQLTDWLLKSKRHRHVSIVPEGTGGARLAKLNYRLVRVARTFGARDAVDHKSQRRDYRHTFAGNAPVSGGKIASLLSIELLTGRKHQIRAQLGHLGHPVLGDRKYGSTEPFPEGIALVCKSIELVHPVSGNRVEWVVDYPGSWAAARCHVD